MHLHLYQVSGYVNYNIGMEPEVRRIELMNQWNILDVHNVDNVENDEV